MAKKPFSFKKWYEDNGKALNESRRQRYLNDHDYKARVREGNKKSRVKAREAAVEERAARYSAKELVVAGNWHTSTITTNSDTKLVTIGALAHMLNRSKIGLRLLEKRGVLPAPAVRSKQGTRLYTPEQVLDIQKLVSGLESSKSEKRVIAEYKVCVVSMADGKHYKLPLFRVGVLAKAVGRSVATVEQMERRGLIPETPLRIPPNRRVYTSEMIEAVSEAFDRRYGSFRGADVKEVHDGIQSAWKNQNVVGAKFISVDSSGETNDEGSEA